MHVEDTGCMTRREVLAALAGLTAAACSSSSTTTVSQTDGGDTDAGAADAGGSTCANPPAGTNLGPVSSYPAGTWTKKNSYIVAQDAKGFFAFTAICTHSGCIVNPPATNGDTLCACHGSKFDGNGAVLQGPAALPLQHFAVALCGGDLYVDDNMSVDAATRTPAA